MALEGGGAHHSGDHVVEYNGGVSVLIIDENTVELTHAAYQPVSHRHGVPDSKWIPVVRHGDNAEVYVPTIRPVELAEVNCTCCERT